MMWEMVFGSLMNRRNCSRCMAMAVSFMPGPKHMVLFGLMLNRQMGFRIECPDIQDRRIQRVIKSMTAERKTRHDIIPLLILLLLEGLLPASVASVGGPGCWPRCFRVQ